MRTKQDIILFSSGMFVSFVMGLVIGNVLWNDSDEILTCQFENMTKKYSTTEAEAKAQTIMVTVTEGERTFMFRRDNLTACYDANETP